MFYAFDKMINVYVTPVLYPFSHYDDIWVCYSHSIVPSTRRHPAQPVSVPVLQS